MKIIKTVREIRELLKNINLKPSGFVPTMGALHPGHISLVRNAVNKCPVVTVSIYINPAQFNDREDLKNYPRTIGSDLELLSPVLRENDIVFTPDDDEIYPVADTREFDFGNAGKVMEALHRPGHFNGVGRVVSRLFEIVQPDVAFFGMKDFQQLAVVRELVRQLGYRIKIEGNPIIREPDGLAMSSRNALLEPEMRQKAPVIYRTISMAAQMMPDKDVPEIKDYIVNTIEKSGGLKVEYFEIVDDKKLVALSKKSEMKKNRHYFGCIAVRAGKIRLIDNIEFPPVMNQKG
jgi:pantoate--beta-alanine ligase